MKVTFEMVDEQVDAIMLQELKQTIETFEDDLYDRENGDGLCIFDTDPIKDIQIINEHLSAFKLIYDYYGGNLK